jgi:hypothetical protein
MTSGNKCKVKDDLVNQLIACRGLDALRKITEKSFRFLAPEPLLGRVLRFDHPLAVGELVVFLSPELLNRPNEIESIIARGKMAKTNRSEIVYSSEAGRFV